VSDILEGIGSVASVMFFQDFFAAWMLFDVRWTNNEQETRLNMFVGVQREQ
jgi:hypothetical protein